MVGPEPCGGAHIAKVTSLWVHENGTSRHRRRIARLRQQLAALAEREGLLLSEVFIETEDATNSAFAVLIDALRANDVTAVVIPSMDHLAHMEGVSIAMKDRIESETGARIVVGSAGRIAS